MLQCFLLTYRISIESEVKNVAAFANVPLSFEQLYFLSMIGIGTSPLTTANSILFSSLFLSLNWEDNPMKKVCMTLAVTVSSLESPLNLLA